MKLCLLILAIFISPFIYCQHYEPFIQNGKLWKYYYSCDGPCSTLDAEVKYHFSGDTIIGNNSYTKLYGEILEYNPNVWGIRDSIYLAALLREDTIARKVYIFYGLDVYSSNPAYNTERILYDFSLTVGDTLTTCSSYWAYTMDYVVHKIDTFQLNNGKKVLRFYDKYYLFQTEVIGSAEIQFDRIWGNPSPNPSISCLLVDGEHIFGKDCSNMTSINVSNYLKSYIRVYPTYVSDIFVVDSRVSEADIHVFDGVGKCIFSKTIHFGENIVNCTNLHNGIYYYFISSGQKSCTGKILKKN